MYRNEMIRGALAVSALFNFGAALAFAFPMSVGQLIALPAAPPVYTTLSAAFIALFGGCYAWLALQQTISRPLVAFAAIGKMTAFALFLILWAFGHASFLLALGGIGDLVFAAIFFIWLRASGAQQGTPADVPASRSRG